MWEALVELTRGISKYVPPKYRNQAKGAALSRSAELFFDVLIKLIEVVFTGHL